MRRQIPGGGIGRQVWRHFSVVVLTLAFALAGCDCNGDLSGADAGPADGGGQSEGCELAFSIRPSSTATSVYLVGGWDDFDRLAHPMAEDSTGTWRISLKVRAGSWGYYFLVNGADVLDPENPQRVQCGDKTCSLLADCRLPGIEADPTSVHIARPSAGQGSFTETLTLIPSSNPVGALSAEGEVRVPDGLAFPESQWRALTAGELVVDGTTATVHLTNLADGKYTVRIHAVQDGVESPEVVLPFWIEEKPFDWRDTPMYMLMTDRFRDGDPTNNPPATAGAHELATFKGGDLQGLQRSIQEGYFDKLGIKSIWITPWQTQPSGTYPDDSGQHQTLGYHGYWPVKAREVDPRFGGGAALASMVKEAHKHGIRIVMDSVLNHVSIEHEYYQDPVKRGWFRTGCNCGQGGCGWDDTPARYYCLFNGNMPDINWTVPEAADQFVSDVIWWMDTFDIDGLRIDAAKHIEPDGIKAMATKVRERFETAGAKVYMFGESYTGNVDFLKEYIGPDKLDAQLNFPVWFAVPEPIFGRDDKGLQAVKGTIEWSYNTFDDYMVTFIGSHDSARFITKADVASRDKQGNKWSDLPAMPTDQRAYDRTYLALLNLVTTPGVPLLYYGDEYGEWGGSDPDNRHMFRADNALNGQQKDLLARVQKLMMVRSQVQGLATGALYQLWCNSDPWGAVDAGGGNLWAYARLDADPRKSAVIVLNLKYESWSGVQVDFPASFGWSSGTVVDALSDREWGISNSAATVDVPGRGGVILRLK
ncbi:MAG: hypothetical protein HY901_30065 [Deltaproteobacteria bacterium]|nr:hypothetical protein [Deltaproteobacteria bacterium]